MLSSEEIDERYPFADLRTLRRFLDKAGVEIKTGVKLEAVNETGAIVTDNNGKNSEIPCDTVVLALGVRSLTEVVKKFLGLAPEVYVVGDSSNERGNLYSATTEGFFAAMEL